MIQRISIVMAFLTGLGMIFIGTRFLLSPEIAEAGYGIHFTEQGDYSFHYIKGIRDIFSGLLLCIFVLINERRALGITLLAGTMIPIVDMLIVLNRSYNGVQQAMPHITAIIVCFVFGVIILTSKSSKKGIKTQGFSKIIHSADTNEASVAALNILPGEKTPWHYHTLFSETFEILKGTLEVGKGKSTLSLIKGDVATIAPNEKHYFHNISKEECIIRVTINPGNKNFENSLLIFKGLANDGLASNAGTPKNLYDLALFIYLNNSRMAGIQKIAEPFFDYLAKQGIKNGRIEILKEKYCRT